MMTENETEPGIEKDRQLLIEAREKGKPATFLAFMRLSGPGWLQSAITLGGGSLSASLYLGVLAGFALLWLQPLAMILGIVMLSAIGYVTLSTGEKPLRAINKHVNPVLGWGWLIATMAANCVWSLPQFSLACGALRQNLFPTFLGESAMSVTAANWITATPIALLCIFMVLLYDKGGLGFKLFDILLKLMVAVIVLSFFGVVVFLFIKGTLTWGKIGGGLIPDFRMLWTPAETFTKILAEAGDAQAYWAGQIVSKQQDVLVAAAATAVGINMTFLLPYSMIKRGWNKDFRGLAVFDLSTGLFIPFILATGCVVIASATQFHTKPAVYFPKHETVTAVANEVEQDSFKTLNSEDQVKRLEALLVDGYEANKLEPAEEKKRTSDVAGIVVKRLGKEKEKEKPGKLDENSIKQLLMGGDGKLIKGYRKIALKRVKKNMGKEAFDKKFKPLKDKLKEAKNGKNKEAIKAATKELDDLTKKLVSELPLAERKIAAMLVSRDTLHLAQALAPLTGEVVAHYVFGIGVVGMAFSTIIILMLINGFCVTEIMGIEGKGLWYRIGCLLPAVGMAGPFIWSGAAPYLAVPTSVFGFILIPIAYITFALLLNQKKLLGDNMPKGMKRVVWNILMLISVILVSVGAVYMAWKKTRDSSYLGSGWYGVGAIIAFLLLALIVHFIRKAKEKGTPA